MDSNQCGRFCILFVKSNIKNKNDYNNFLLQDLNIKAFMTKNNRYMIKSTCNICKGKKSKFISKKEIMGSGFLSNLFSKIPILNKII